MKQQFSLAITLLIGAIALQGCNENRAPAPAPLANSAPSPMPESTPMPTPPPAEARTAAAPVLASPAVAAPSEQSSASQQVAARLAGQPISMDRLNKALLEGYGINMLGLLVQLDYTKQEAARAKVVVTPEDVARERDLSFAARFPDLDKSEYQTAFDQLLKNTHTSRIEWDLSFETNAYIRKMIEPEAKKRLSDPDLELAFRQMYGETVQVHHIEIGNSLKLVEVKRRLAAGEPFEKVAAELSENAHTAPLGGELPPFSRAASYDQLFKDTAFLLKEGEVSDAIQLAGVYQIIKLDRRIPPKGVKFEDVKESIREDLTARYVQAMMERRRGELRDEAVKALVLENPTLKSQFEEQTTKRTQQTTNRNDALEQFKARQEQILKAATQPVSARPAPNAGAELPSPTGNPPAAPGVARPPATQSGAQ